MTLWAIFFLAVQSTVGPYIVASGKVWRVVKLFAIVFPIGAGVLWTLVSGEMGVTGAAVGTVLTMGMMASAELFVAMEASGVSAVK